MTAYDTAKMISSKHENSRPGTLESWKAFSSPPRSLPVPKTLGRHLKPFRLYYGEHAKRPFQARETGRKSKSRCLVSSHAKNKWGGTDSVERSIVNEAAAASPVQPIINMGQGFYGYNPPQFVLDAAKQVLDRVDCNQYSPTKGRPRLRKAIADAYSPFWGRELDPDKEITITTGANEGMLSAFMGFLEQGDEVIVFEPFFDQ